MNEVIVKVQVWCVELSLTYGSFDKALTILN